MGTPQSPRGVRFGGGTPPSGGGGGRKAKKCTASRRELNFRVLRGSVFGGPRGRGGFDPPTFGFQGWLGPVSGPSGPPGPPSQPSSGPPGPPSQPSSGPLSVASWPPSRPQFALKRGFRSRLRSSSLHPAPNSRSNVTFAAGCAAPASIPPSIRAQTWLSQPAAQLYFQPQIATRGERGSAEWAQPT